MKKKLTGFLGFGDKGELWICDGCGKETTGGCSGFNKDGLFQSLKNGEFCFECLKKVDKDASHLWTALNDSNNHFGSCFTKEMDSNPPTHLDYCAKCFTYRAIQKLSSGFKATYYPIGSKVSTMDAPICKGENSENPQVCKHDYVKVFSNEKNPSSSEIKDSDGMLKEIQGNPVGQMFGYTDIDMYRSTYGFSCYWCCKCGHSRTITKGQVLPTFGTDRNYPSRYST
jgi:hypothetical protein